MTQGAHAGSIPRDLGDAERRQVRAVVRLVRATLREEVLGAWLYGSAASGGLQPASDLDILVLARRRTTDDEKQRLVRALLPISGRRARHGPARSIELSIVTEPDVRPWRYPPRLDFQYGDWLRDDFERGDVEPWPNPNPDLAVLLTTVRTANRPLFGPAARDAIEPVPHEDLVRAMADEVSSLLGDVEGDARNVVLTLARMWVTLATGEIRSKDAAAGWALERLPEDVRPALAHARAVYVGQAAEDWSGVGGTLRPLIDRLVDEIQRLAAADAAAP